MKVRGLCHTCLQVRAVEFVEQTTNMRPYYVLGSAQVHYTLAGNSLCKGKCSGHPDEVVFFSPMFFNHRDIRWRRREPDTKRFRRDLDGLTEYKQWRQTFRRTGKEDHFKQGHECAFGCPEYVGDWGPDYCYW